MVDKGAEQLLRIVAEKIEAKDQKILRLENEIKILKAELRKADEQRYEQ